MHRSVYNSSGIWAKKSDNFPNQSLFYSNAVHMLDYKIYCYNLLKCYSTWNETVQLSSTSLSYNIFCREQMWKPLQNKN